MYNKNAMIAIINQTNLYPKGISKKGEMIMKIYKKLFAYVEDKKYLGFLAIVFSAISAVLTVYGYYLIYKFLDKLIINSNLSGAESLALKSVITLTSGAIFYFVPSMYILDRSMCPSSTSILVFSDSISSMNGSSLFLQFLECS